MKKPSTPDPAAVPDEGLSYKHAAERIGKSVRTIERLVKTAALKSMGVGQGRRITLASIESYVETDRERFCDIHRDMSGPLSRSSGYGEKDMQKLMRTVPPLSAPQSAARRLGISCSQLENLLRAGHVPSIQIGPERFIPGGWLMDVLVRAYGRKGGA